MDRSLSRHRCRGRQMIDNMRELLRQYFDAHPPHMWSREHCASYLCISSSAVGYRCRTAGISFYAEMRRRKVAVAVEKLRDGSMVKSVYDLAGYSRPGCLSRALVAEGLTAKQIKRAAAAERIRGRRA